MHMDVRKLSFTGSTLTGKRILEYSARVRLHSYSLHEPSLTFLLLLLTEQPKKRFP
jgi:hypothetical protein